MGSGMDINDAVYMVRQTIFSAVDVIACFGVVIVVLLALILWRVW